MLLSSDVQIWHIPLDQPTPLVERLARLLSRDEVMRADRMAFPSLRRRFTVARGVLRILLGSYLRTPPQYLCFNYGPSGKPELSSPGKLETVSFNLAHSSDQAIYAFSIDRRLGVDLEYIDPEIDYATIAGRFFSTCEVVALRALPTEIQRLAFFACWTRKEAYIKATGQGFACDLDSFDVSVDPEKDAQLMRVPGDQCDLVHWRLCDLDVGPDYRAALAVFGSPCNLTYLRWPDDLDEISRSFPR